MSRPLYCALIRTHHITSRKKLQRVRRAAQQLGLERLLVRSGGSPGVMFAESHDRARLAEWVAAVQALRYKDFRCVTKPEERPENTENGNTQTGAENGTGMFFESQSMAEFARRMEEHGLGPWWRRGMGYENG